jgi:2-polyprenyl-3-methyl-5-hydroxy-6-metoxy-1,4-benzoquinol methylase
MNEMPKAYFGYERHELLPLLPNEFTSALDVGCASGGFGRTLRRANADAVLWGIEPSSLVDEQGWNIYERVIKGLFPDVLNQIDRTFDLVVLNDVLEHMEDPWAALTRVHELMSTNAYVLVSLPNIANFRIVKQLVLNKFTYTDEGVLDRTHLRFFTDSSAREMFSSAGLEVVNMIRLMRVRHGLIGWLIERTGLLHLNYQQSAYLCRRIKNEMA